MYQRTIKVWTYQMWFVKFHHGTFTLKINRDLVDHDVFKAVVEEDRIQYIGENINKIEASLLSPEEHLKRIGKINKAANGFHI